MPEENTATNNVVFVVSPPAFPPYLPGGPNFDFEYVDSSALEVGQYWHIVTAHQVGDFPLKTGQSPNPGVQNPGIGSPLADSKVDLQQLDCTHEPMLMQVGKFVTI